MVPHIVLLVCICGLAIIISGATKRREKRNKLVLRCSLALIFLIEALRGIDVGLDTKTYEYAFKDIIAYGFFDFRNSYWTRRWITEPGWIVLNKLVGLFTDNPQWLLAATALIIVSGLHIFIRRNLSDKQSVFWSVFFFMTLSYLYTSSMNLMREFIAIAIGCNIFTVLRNEKLKHRITYSIMLLVVALSFHNMAVTYIAVFYILLGKPSRKKSLFFFCVSLLVVVAFPIALKLLVRVFPSYTFYIEQSNEYYDSVGLSKYNLTMIVLRVLCSLLILLSNHSDVRNKNMVALGMLNSLSIMCLLLSIFTNLATRVGYYYDIYIILMLPELINASRTIRRYKNIIYPITFVLGWAFFIFELNTTGARGTVPYLFFWQ